MSERRHLKSVADRVVYDDTLSGHTYLSLVHERAEGRGLYRLVQFRVVQNDQRRLSSQFEENGLETMRRDLRDDSAKSSGIFIFSGG
jgi:hypothetical protein